MSASLAFALILMVAAAIVSALACMGWMRFAHARGLFDVPGGRRVHSQITPRGGGIGIALVLLLLTIVLALQASPLASAWCGLAIGIVLLTVLGLVDDLRSLSALPKFCLQWLAALAMLIPLLRQMPMPMLVLILLPASLVTVAVINVWNFMDGSHGLVTVQGALIALAVAFVPGQDMDLRFAAFVLAGACLGFLPFNFPNARVFLGDIGSHVLAGGVVGLLLISLHLHTLTIAQALMISSVMLIDAGVTLLRRACSGRVLWQAHREHLYQFAVRCGRAPWQVCLAYGTATALAIGVALALSAATMLAQCIATLLLFATGVIAHAGLRRRLLQRRRRSAA